MRDSTPLDPIHPSTVVPPGDVYRAAHNLRIKNPSDHTFPMYVQLVDEINFKTYRYYTKGQGWRVVTIDTPDPQHRKKEIDK